MYVLQWRIALQGNSSYSVNQPGLALILKLECPACSSVCEASYDRPITPQIVREGHTGHPDGGLSVPDSSDWFNFAVESRLALQRSCDQCGIASVMPPRQKKALIVASNAAMSSQWLRKAVADFNFESKTTPATSTNWPSVVYVAKAGITAMDWVSFEPATV